MVRTDQVVQAQRSRAERAERKARFERRQREQEEAALDPSRRSLRRYATSRRLRRAEGRPAASRPRRD